MNNSTCEGGECGIAVGPTPLLVLPVILSVLWVLFDLFYASIILGFLVNKIANLFLKESEIHVGMPLNKCSKIILLGHINSP